MRAHRTFLLPALAIALFGQGIGQAAEPPLKGSRCQDAAKRGRAFLAGLFDPSIGLLPEYRGSKTYWLHHDNYLVVCPARVY